MKRLLCALALLLIAAPAFAEKLSWQQEAPVNPSGWTYRLYADVGPFMVNGVVCTGNPPEFDCSAPFPITVPWDRGYLTAENAAGESLPSNPIYSSTPIQLTKPSAPKNLKRLP